MNIDLAGLAVAPKARAKSKDKPSLPDPEGALHQLVVSGVEAKQNLNAWDATLKATNATLGTAAVRHAFALYHGRSGDIEDTFQVVTSKGKALVSLKNAYKLPEDLSGVRALLGEHADRYLNNSYTLSIDLDAMPSFLVQTFVDELVALAKRLEEMTDSPAGTVAGAITVKPEVTVAKSFHEERHSVFTPQQNAAIHTLMPCVVSVKYDF